MYSICSPNLPPTCTDQAGQSDPCRPGCACPTGTVMRERDEKCVDPVLCDGEDHFLLKYVQMLLTIECA